MKKLVPIVLLSLLVIGCAKRNFNGRFSSVQLSEETYQVNFTGKGFMRIQRVMDYVLIRCAELALEQDYEWFAVVDDGWIFLGNDKKGISRIIGPNNASQPHASMTIMCYKERPDIGVLVYNARAVSKALRAKYRMKTKF